MVPTNELPMRAPKNNASIDSLQAELFRYNGAVVYEPLPSEVNWKQSPLIRTPENETVVLPTVRDADPFEWAQTCIERFCDMNPYLFIPGSMFDLNGTRHGKGGGWYDRFLSTVPREWLRIGVANQNQVSQSLLRREAWDEPVDRLLVYNGKTWIAHRCRRATTEKTLIESAGKM